MDKDRIAFLTTTATARAAAAKAVEGGRWHGKYVSARFLLDLLNDIDALLDHHPPTSSNDERIAALEERVTRLESQLALAPLQPHDKDV